jgi:hypothetical protein
MRVTPRAVAALECPKDVMPLPVGAADCARAAAACGRLIFEIFKGTADKSALPRYAFKALAWPYTGVCCFGRNACPESS